MKGRKPKPKATVDPPKSPTPPPPSWFSAHAKAEWLRAAPEVHSRALLTPDTRATLESYCLAVGQVRETEELMQAEGRVVSSDNGPKAHPAFRIQSAAMREARLLAAELGLTPHRKGGSGDKPKVDDGWDPDILP